MRHQQEYDILGNVDKDIFKVYPRLIFLSDGLKMEKVKVPVDTLVKYVVYFYNRHCSIHKEIPNIEMRRQHCLSLFGIEKKWWDDENFSLVELNVAEKYMMLSGDTKFQLYISSLFKFSEMCKNLMDRSGKFKWEDGKSAVQVSGDLSEMEERLEGYYAELFGDMDALQKFMVNKAVRNNHTAEGMAE